MAQSSYLATRVLLGVLLVGVAVTPNMAAASLTARSIERPHGLEFPTAWTFLVAAPATHIWGLTQYLYYVDASVSAVRYWAQQAANQCVDHAELGQPDRLQPNATAVLRDLDHADNSPAPTLLWFCADATRLYSFLQWHTTVLWAVSERQTTHEDAFVDRLAEFLHALGANQLHQSSTAFEQLSIYQTERTLLALQADLLAYIKRNGLQLSDHQTAHNGLVMSWQQGPLRTQISAVRQPDGRVVLTHVTGTNL